MYDGVPKVSCVGAVVRFAPPEVPRTCSACVIGRPAARCQYKRKRKQPAVKERGGGGEWGAGQPTRLHIKKNESSRSPMVHMPAR